MVKVFSAPRPYFLVVGCGVADAPTLTLAATVGLVYKEWFPALNSAHFN